MEMTSSPAAPVTVGPAGVLVAGERLERILAVLSAGREGEVAARRLCETATAVLGVNGSGVMLMSGDVAYGSLCTTNEQSALIEELQYSLGEGPCVDAYNYDRVIAEPDLADPAAARWAGFTPQALQVGVRAVFAFPLRVGAVRLGALDLYKDRPGHLSDHQHADALVIADLVASWVLDTQAGAPLGSVAAALDTEADFHLVVHSAAGMVSVQLGVSVTEAMLRLRAYAFGHGRPLTSVADDVVTGTLRFE
jgi:hypothetical protein